MSDSQAADARAHEYQKWLHELKREDAQRAHDRIDDFAQAINIAAIENGNLALRYAVLINGGAAVAVLGFIGALVGHDRAVIADASSNLAHAAVALTWFAIGVAAATLAMGFAYFTNYSIAGSASTRTKIAEHPWTEHSMVSKRWMIASFACELIAIGLGFASIALFIAGMYSVKDAIVHLLS